ncbi:hypothetical protein [Streptomyces sp. NPDC046727]
MLGARPAGVGVVRAGEFDAVVVVSEVDQDDPPRTTSRTAMPLPPEA